MVQNKYNHYVLFNLNRFKRYNISSKVLYDAITHRYKLLTYYLSLFTTWKVFISATITNFGASFFSITKISQFLEFLTRLLPIELVCPFYI